MGGDIGILELIAPGNRTFIERCVSHSIHDNPGDRLHIFLLKKARTRKTKHLTYDTEAFKCQTTDLNPGSLNLESMVSVKKP